MSNKEIFHEWTAEIVCPWCGYSFEDDDYGYCDSNGEPLVCDGCQKDFTVTGNITVEYSTAKIVPKERKC